MLADLITWINGNYLTLFLVMLAGACFALAGLIGVIVFRRKDLTLGEHLTVRFETPPPVYPPRAPKAHLAREDPDTGVVPRIPGATRELSPQLAAVARYLDAVDAEETAALTPIEGLREERIDEVPAEVLQRVRDGLADLGPVCPICGAPFHAVCPSAPKAETLSAVFAKQYLPEHQPTQEIDLCPLTTQDIVIDAAAPHFAETFTRHPRAELGTQELSGSLARAKESAA